MLTVGSIGGFRSGPTIRRAGSLLSRTGARFTVRFAARRAACVHVVVLAFLYLTDGGLNTAACGLFLESPWRQSYEKSQEETCGSRAELEEPPKERQRWELKET